MPIIGRFLEELGISEEQASLSLIEELRGVEEAYRFALENESTVSQILIPEVMPTGSFLVVLGEKAPLIEGTLIGARYRLREKRGTGGMSVVW